MDRTESRIDCDVIKARFPQDRSHRSGVHGRTLIELRLAKLYIGGMVASLFEEGAHGINAAWANHIFDVEERRFHGCLVESNRVAVRVGLRVGEGAALERGRRVVFGGSSVQAFPNQLAAAQVTKGTMPRNVTANSQKNTKNAPNRRPKKWSCTPKR